MSATPTLTSGACADNSRSNATVGQLEQELQATLHHLQLAVAASDTQNVTSLAQQALLQIKQRNALLENSGV